MLDANSHHQKIIVGKTDMNWTTVGLRTGF